jgi:hypothetical protein
LKLAQQPKMVPLSQPTHIMVPASLKFGGLGSGNHNAAPGKIVNLPVGGLNKSDALQNSKLDREVSRIDHRPAKSFAQIRDHQGPVRMSRSNFGRPPRNGNLRFASTQIHGSAFRPQFRPGGGGLGGHGFGGGGFGGGGFGRR